jgi:hypothetical protein
MLNSDKVPGGGGCQLDMASVHTGLAVLARHAAGQSVTGAARFRKLSSARC